MECVFVAMDLTEEYFSTTEARRRARFSTVVRRRVGTFFHLCQRDRRLPPGGHVVRQNGTWP